MATLAAFAHRRYASAHDDVMKILLLVPGEWTGRSSASAQAERLRCLGELAAAAVVLAQAARVLLGETIADPPDPAWRRSVSWPGSSWKSRSSPWEQVVTVPGERLRDGLDRR